MNDGRATLREVEQARIDENEKWIAFYDAQFTQERARLDLLRQAGNLAASIQYRGLTWIFVECDFRHQLRLLHVHRIAVARDFQLQQFLRLPGQHFIGQSFERLPEHGEASTFRVARAEVEIAQPTAPSATAPLRRPESPDPACACLLDFEPALPACPRCISRRPGFRHHPFMTSRQRRMQEFFRTRRLGAGDRAQESGFAKPAPVPSAGSANRRACVFVHQRTRHSDTVRSNQNGDMRQLGAASRYDAECGRPKRRIVVWNG